ncbi:Mitochondrial intermediate peptidase [Tilletia horrida]|uniref:mitochondrial intermediate peptidase n=1 Tax=Tilletia horrida TaxID=155126 RepID=A0AAN6JU36_9BASI|nr:Mitochondrial intermediate peptidase [Tilletia horrida]
MRATAGIQSTLTRISAGVGAEHGLSRRSAIASPSSVCPLRHSSRTISSAFLRASLSAPQRRHYASSADTTHSERRLHGDSLQRQAAVSEHSSSSPPPSPPPSYQPESGARLSGRFAAPPLFRSSTSIVEADAKELRALFDSPTPTVNNTKQKLTSSSSALNPAGLFDSPSLSTPDNFLAVARRTHLRAQLLVHRIVSAPQNGREEMSKVVRNLDRLSNLLCTVIDCAELVRNAHPNQAWVRAANDAYEYLCGYMNVLNTHQGLYTCLSKVLDDHSLVDQMSAEELAVAHVFLRDFERSGIHLPDESRGRFVRLSDEILVLGRSFLSEGANGSSNNGRPPALIPLHWLNGTSASLVSAVRKRSRTFRNHDKEQTLVVPADSWELQAISRLAPDERARKAAYLAANSGSDEQVSTLERLLRARIELAQLTGKSCYAEMTLGDKMARRPEHVEEFLSTLAKHHQPRAQATLDALRRVKQRHVGGSLPAFYAWDREYYAEQYMRQEILTTPSLPISSYFSVGSVFAGLSRLFSRIYGIRLRAAPIRAGEVWAPDVHKLEVVEESNALGADRVVGTIYADLFSRPGKPPSAAHYTVRCSRRTDLDDHENDFKYGRLLDGQQLDPQIHAGEVEPLEVPTVPATWTDKGEFQIPNIVLLCDFSRPTVKDGPSLLNWAEVETLFHEMGHAMHSMIGRTEYHNVSGTRCATDFVELPSILMEHFLASPPVVELVARHHATDAPLPYHHLASHVKSARALDSLDTQHQILLASLDQLYHSPSASDPSFNSTRELGTLTRQIGALPLPPDESETVSWQTQFGHLFGYGATYYSYLFDRAIASQIWSKLFAQDPLDRKSGELFKTGVLRYGGGKDPWQMLSAVLGDEEIAAGDSKAMQAVGRWGIADLGSQTRQL